MPALGGAIDARYHDRAGPTAQRNIDPADPPVYDPRRAPVVDIFGRANDFLLFVEAVRQRIGVFRIPYPPDFEEE
jgi:hypothetical protein